MCRTRLVLYLSVLLVLCVTPTLKSEVTEFEARITDVTVFKDGHALVMSKAKAEFQDGWCRTRDVPVPVLGTFWAFAVDKNAKVERVKAGFVEIEEERPCLSFVEMIQANAGKKASIVEKFDGSDPVTHEGRLLGILEHEAEKELDTTRSIPAGRDAWGNYRRAENVSEAEVRNVSSRASFVMLESADGVRLIKLENVKGINLIDQDFSTKHIEKKKVREISMRVVEKGRPVKKKGEVGMVYLQRGIRWIPSYTIELIDGGKAKVSLKGVIINDVSDLENVNLRLVVGVPSFVMKDNISPMALRERGLKLSSYFQPPSRGGQGSQHDYLFNAMMSQAVVRRDAAGPPSPGGPDIPGEGQTEDLFLYEVKGFSLEKGERAVVDLIEVTVPYEDVYTWDIPSLPPREMWRHVNRDQQKQLAAALSAAKAIHKIRLTNTGEVPWTTGPAMIFKDGALLGQQLVTYTSIKNEVDVPVTVATDLNTKKEESETGRTPNIKISGDSYTKVSLHGKLTITNFKDTAVKVEVKRMAMGNVTSATADGKIVRVNAMEDSSIDARYPWHYWSWPWWWYGVNPISKVTWKKTIKAGESATFEYDWYYHYRH